MAGELPRRPRRRPGENRERLLEAGISEFGVHGYRGASTLTIAAAADVPQPHVYANFATKRELFLACAQRVVTTLSETPRVEESAQRYASFLLQAIASLGESELQEELRPLLHGLRDRLGDAIFDGALIRGAAEALG